MIDGRSMGVMLLAYLLGCFNSGYYLVRFRQGDDIRRYGSGNAGARNTGRVLGKTGFILAFLGDCLKGIVTASLALFLGLSLWGVMLALVAVVVGHIWPVQLCFRGGKGMATALGGMLVIDPLLTLILGGIALAALALIRRFTLSGLIAVGVSPLVAFVAGRPQPLIAGVALLALLIWWAHRTNLKEDLPGLWKAGRSDRFKGN
jgi:glycerol-3-phosphate acyltransferase PlsY